MITSLYVGSLNPKDQKDCRHIYRNSSGRYAYSDVTGAFYVDLDRAEADKHFNAAVIKPKVAPDIEDIDATLKEIEKNIKVIYLRALSYLSDVIDKQVNKLS
jgi:hypothetical protein